MPAPNHSKALRGVKRRRPLDHRDGLLAGVDEIWIDFFLSRVGSDAEETVLGVENDAHVLGCEVAG